MSSLRLAALLGMTVALGPLALDTYLPAFPEIAAGFDTDLPAVGRTLSVYVVVLGVAQLVGGPLSDRYGRRGILLVGLSIFAVSSLMVAGAEDLGDMLAWRVVQAIGGAWCAVSVPAIVRDRARGTEAARLIALIGLVMFVAPAVAPSLGSAVLYLTRWQGIFILLAGYALLLAVTLHLFLFRHLPAGARTATPVHTLATNYLTVLRNSTAMRFIVMQTLAFSVLMVFLTHAAFIYQDWFGVSNMTFSMLFAANVIGMVVANLANRRLLLRFHSSRILRAAVAIQSIAVLALLACSLLGASIVPVAAALIVAAGAMGAIAPNNIANTLEFFPTLGGTASALLGATQFSMAGVISAVSTWLADGTLVPIALLMTACTLTALLFAIGAPAAMRRALADDAGSQTAEPMARS